MSPDELIAVIERSLDEDEKTATRCGYVRRTWDGPYAMDDQCTGGVGHGDKHGPWRMLKPAPPQANRQMAEHERRRVLADIESKREILAQYDVRHSDDFVWQPILAAMARPYLDRDTP